MICRVICFLVGCPGTKADFLLCDVPDDLSDEALITRALNELPREKGFEYEGTVSGLAIESEGRRVTAGHRSFPTYM